MSAYATVDCEFKDIDSLSEALEEEGFKTTIHREGTIISVQGKNVKVHIEVDKHKLYGRAGFERTEKGTMKLHCDDIDVRRLSNGKIKQSYAEKQLIKAARRSGKWTVKSKTIDELGNRKIKLLQIFN